MASAIRPSSTVKVSVFEMLSGDRKAGLIAAKTAISRIKQHEGAELRRRYDAAEGEKSASSPITGGRAAEG